MRFGKIASLGFSLGIGMLGAAALADPNPGNVIYGLTECVTGGTNNQCPVGNDSYVRAPDPGVVGYDIVQPVAGDLYFDVSGGNASIIHSPIDIFFTVTINVSGLSGYVTTDITSRIEGAVGNVVGDDIQWTGSEQFISNGVIDCALFFVPPATPGPACEFFTDYAQGMNVFVEGCNTTVDTGAGECGATNPPTPDPTAIVLPDFSFSANGANLLHTGEFNINKAGEANLFLALEATYVPEPGVALALVPGMLLLFALDRRRAAATR